MLGGASIDRASDWYLGVYCRRCDSPIPVFRDLGGEAVIMGRGKLTVCCAACGKKARYEAKSVVSFLIPPAEPEVSPTPVMAPVESAAPAPPIEPVIEIETPAPPALAARVVEEVQ